MEKHHRQDFEYIFGEDIEDMYNRIQPEERYLPDMKAAWNSPERIAKHEFMWDFM